jgi:hypothetical protein
MKKADRRRRVPHSNPAALDALVDEVLVDAYGEDEQLWAFRQAFEDHVCVPCDGTVVGEPVKVIQFDYDGNTRRALTSCRRADGREYVVAASDVVLAPTTQGDRYIAAYRKWLGLSPRLSEHGRKERPQLCAPVPDLQRERIDLVVLSVKQKTARCRLLENAGTVTLRAGRLWKLSPGWIATVKPRKQWTYSGIWYLSGEIESTRLDVAALNLVPLRLEEQGEWNPAEEYWGEEGEPIEEWAKPIIARGPRPEFEMEQVLPGADSEDPFSDPISKSNDCKDRGQLDRAYRILMGLCETDLRCLDAHSHLGNLAFELAPQDAIRHYEAGFRIGGLSLGDGFDGVLRWAGLTTGRFFDACTASDYVCGVWSDLTRPSGYSIACFG